MYYTLNNLQYSLNINFLRSGKPKSFVTQFIVILVLLERNPQHLQGLFEHKNELYELFHLYFFT